MRANGISLPRAGHFPSRGREHSHARQAGGFPDRPSQGSVSGWAWNSARWHSNPWMSRGRSTASSVISSKRVVIVILVMLVSLGAAHRAAGIRADPDYHSHDSAVHVMVPHRHRSGFPSGRFSSPSACSWTAPSWSPSPSWSRWREGKTAVRAALDSASELGPSAPDLHAHHLRGRSSPFFWPSPSSGSTPRPIFKVVAITLLSAWVLSMTLMPLLCVRFMKNQAGNRRRI